MILSKDKIILTDAIGNEIPTSLYDMFYIVEDGNDSTSINLTDDEHLKLINFQTAIVDSEGKPYDLKTLLDSASSDPSKLPQAIDVLIEVTHSGDNANSVMYKSDSMEKDSQSFMWPYKKPFLKNHDMEVEPIGRVLDSNFGPSEITDRDTINVCFRVTDKDAMMKFLDGRYRTVSIGGSPTRVSCNICGKDILKDGQLKFCGHYKGNIYNNQKAIWTCTDITYNEVSVVNNPADKWAQVKKITIVNSDKPTQKDGVQDMNNPNLVNEILGNDGEQNPTPAPVVTPTPVEDGQQGEQTPPVDTPPTEPNQVEDKDAKIVELNATIETLTSEKETLTSDNEKLTTQVTDLTAKVDELNEKVLLSDADAKTSRDQALKVAVKYRELLVGQVKDFSLVAKVELKDDELEALTVQQLNDKVTELKGSLNKTTIVPPVANPGLVDNNGKQVINDDNKPSSENKNTIKDYKSVESGLVAKLVR